MASCFSHRTSDLGVLPFGSGLLAFRPVVDALHSRALTLRSHILAFVGAQLSFVSQLLAVICDQVALICDAISFVSDPSAPQGLTLTPSQSRLAVIQISSALIELGVITGHDLL